MLIRLVFAILLPIAVFTAGVVLLFSLSDRGIVVDQLKTAALEDRTPLYQRHYDVDTAARHWESLKPDGLKAERLFLVLDLVFPVLCGAALLTSLMILCSLLGWPLQLLWLAAPVLLMVVSDWVENLIQLIQLSRFVEGGRVALHAGWIEVSSAATVVKLTASLGLVISVVVLSVCVVFRLFKAV